MNLSLRDRDDDDQQPLTNKFTNAEDYGATGESFSSPEEIKPNPVQDSSETCLW